MDDVFPVDKTHVMNIIKSTTKRLAQKSAKQEDASAQPQSPQWSRSQDVKIAGSHDVRLEGDGDSATRSREHEHLSKVTRNAHQLRLPAWHDLACQAQRRPPLQVLHRLEFPPALHPSQPLLLRLLGVLPLHSRPS